MRLNPPQILNCNSNVEKKIFGFLLQVGFSDFDVAIHSLNIGHHEYKRWGEADFIILSRRGILLLEVKGGRVACKNGLWEFTNRFGEKNTKRESPAEQAKSAYFSIEKEYLKPLLAESLRGIPTGWGVVYPDIPRIGGSSSVPMPEQPVEITAYDEDCRGHNTFRRYLDRCYSHWESKQRSPRNLSPTMIGKILAALRPNFERVPSLDLQLQNLRQELCEFTEEQYQRLDEIAENDRIFISGGAGTGKTFLAVACTRYESAGGKKLLLVTRSPYLACYLQALDIPGKVTVATIEEVDDLLEANGPWDCLIVDEGQDLCDAESIDILDNALVGGLEKGRWRWFGDPNHQVSNSFPIDAVSYEYLRGLGFKCRLKQNIRNAGRVVEAIQHFTGADIGKPRGLPSAGSVSLKIAETRDGVVAEILSTLKRWLTGEGAASRGDVVVLVNDEEDPDSAAKLLSGKGYRAESLSKRAMGKSTRNCVLVARVEDFKGLERPLVCVAGLPGESDDLVSRAYKAMSRANHHLTIIASKKTATSLAKTAVEHLAAGKEEHGRI